LENKYRVNWFFLRFCSQKYPFLSRISHKKLSENNQNLRVWQEKLSRPNPGPASLKEWLFIGLAVSTPGGATAASSLALRCGV
jgi:hypothetical protein